MKLRKWSAVLILPVIVAVVLCFLSAVSSLQRGQDDEGRRQLEDVLRRTAVACYAAEGVYPPDLEYMQEYYGIRFNEEEYAVIYTPVASNLMPDITVLELTP